MPLISFLNKMQLEFEHTQSAHCENGVASNLLKYNGLSLSEPMVFGIGSGLLFFYFPWIKVNQAPAISYRTMPGHIFSKVAKRLGFKVFRKKFSSEKEAQQVLDQTLSKGIPVGLQVGVYHLPYFPEQYRFHFNAHNLVVYGKQGDSYLISDPVMEFTTELSATELERVRFANMLRMQEEIGTGGGGFRFIYGAFLQEAAEVLQEDRLKTLSQEITEIGDRWRDFAVAVARLYKERNSTPNAYEALSKTLYDIAQSEKNFFKKLKAVISER